MLQPVLNRKLEILHANQPTILNKRSEHAGNCLSGLIEFHSTNLTLYLFAPTECFACLGSSGGG